LEGPSWPWSYGSWIYNYLCNQCLPPLMLWLRISIKARCTTLCNKDCQRLATGRWFSPAPPPTKLTAITEILLKVALNTIKQTLIVGRITNSLIHVGYIRKMSIYKYYLSKQICLFNSMNCTFISKLNLFHDYRQVWIIKLLFR